MYRKIGDGAIYEYLRGSQISPQLSPTNPNESQRIPSNPDESHRIQSQRIPTNHNAAFCFRRFDFATHLSRNAVMGLPKRGAGFRRIVSVSVRTSWRLICFLSPWQFRGNLRPAWDFHGFVGIWFVVSGFGGTGFVGFGFYGIGRALVEFVGFGFAVLGSPVLNSSVVDLLVLYSWVLDLAYWICRG